MSDFGRIFWGFGGVFDLTGLGGGFDLTTGVFIW